MTKVAVSNAVLQWVIQRSEDSSTIHQKFPKLGEWLTGASQPTMRQLEDLAAATATPLGYFFLTEPPEERLPIPHYRTLDDRHDLRPSPDLLETVQTMERRQAWMREYLVEQGEEQLSFVSSASVTDDLDTVARQIRETLGLEDDWAADQPSWTGALSELQRSVERAGILLVVNGIVGNNTHRKLDVREFRGFVLVDEYCPLVFINGADGKAAQMFSLAHELAHIWFGKSAAFDLQELHPASNAVERASNWVAAEFLVPAKELCGVWERLRNAHDRFQQVARRFKVSEVVAARRALDLSLITRNEFSEFYQAYLEDERRAAAQQSDGGNFYATQNLRVGRRFAETVITATREGRLLFRDAYHLTGLYGKTFTQFAQKLVQGGLS
ncbi:MAG TPA: ImmA/IrrE family metallo-endopeptidase [Symbiobacteriaceae bacterium]